MVFRKRPVEIQAVQWRGDNFAELNCFVGPALRTSGGPSEPVELYIHTLEGDMHVEYMDYVIQGVQGEFYPCKPDIFQLTYEYVREDGECSDV